MTAFRDRRAAVYLANAARKLLVEIDGNLDTKAPPGKYTVPWGAATQLREALRYYDGLPSILDILRANPIAKRIE